MRLGTALLLCAGLCATAAAQESAGLVNQVSGSVTYAARGDSVRPVQNFMRLSEGDRIVVPSGGSVRVLFFQGNRQETWRGPASFRVGRDRGEGSGDPDVAVLPSAVPLKMARVPELIQAARLGGVTVRGAKIPPRGPLTIEEQSQLSQARGNYGVLRSQFGSDDITPELYMLSTLDELRLFEDMSPMLDEIVRRGPMSPEVEELVRWFRSRQGG
jgi:hypothetical protein